MARGPRPWWRRRRGRRIGTLRLAFRPWCWGQGHLQAADPDPTAAIGPAACRRPGAGYHGGPAARSHRAIEQEPPMSDRFDCSGSVAAVIGATGVLGGAIAEGLGEAGAKVAVLGRNAERGGERVDEIAEAGGSAAFVASTPPIAPASEGHGRGRGRARSDRHPGECRRWNDPKVTVVGDHSFEGIDAADWNANFDLNLVGGAVFPCQVVGPRMAARGKGSIINIASVSAHIPLSRVVSYSAAKAAVLSLTKFLAREWAEQGVRVNTITPGFFPGGTEPPSAVQRGRFADRTCTADPRPHPDEPLRHRRRARRCRGLPGRARRVQLRHRHRHLRRWRFPRDHHLTLTESAENAEEGRRSVGVEPSPTSARFRIFSRDHNPSHRPHRPGRHGPEPHPQHERPRLHRVRLQPHHLQGGRRLPGQRGQGHQRRRCAFDSRRWSPS